MRLQIFIRCNISICEHNNKLEVMDIVLDLRLPSTKWEHEILKQLIVFEFNSEPQQSACQNKCRISCPWPYIILLSMSNFLMCCYLALEYG